MLKVFKKSFLLVIIAIVTLFLGTTAVNAESKMSKEFESYLNKDGKFEMNSAIPTNEDYFASMVDLVTYDENQNWTGLMFTNVSSDYSEVDLTINAYEADEEKHRVKLQWNYDETANKKIQNYINTTFKDKKTFEVNDLELVNYWYNLIKNEYKAELIMYSGELKSALNYGNIEFEVSTRGGGSAPFQSERIGFAYFGYDGSVYHVVNGFGATGDHILYVPTETENTPEAIQQAAQERIDDYIGDSDVEVCYLSTAEEFAQRQNINMSTYPSFEEGFEYEMGLSGVSENDLVYSVDVFIDENSGDSRYVIIRRDSSKMINPTSKTADLSTNIEISTNETLPLDTIIQAKELSEGTEYEQIVKKLDLTDSKTFDLKLYSNSLKKYITKLSDGKFEVTIPIPEGFKGEDLVAYYVDENGDIEDYEVEPKDNYKYATFKTTHFSIYTLGYKSTAPISVKVTFDANGGKFGNENTYTINDWTAEQYDSLTKPTRDGYTFRGYYTEKTGGTKFEMILNEAGIDNNMTFYAQWEENSSEVPPTIEGEGQLDNNVNTDNTNTDIDKNDDIDINTVKGENPKTGDNILFYVGMLFIAVIGVTATIVYMKHYETK